MKELQLNQEYFITKKPELYSGLEHNILELYYSSNQYSFVDSDIQNYLNVSGSDLRKALNHLVENDELTFEKSKGQNVYLLSMEALTIRLVDCLDKHKKYTELLSKRADAQNISEGKEHQFIRNTIMFNKEVKGLIEQKLDSYFNAQRF